MLRACWPLRKIALLALLSLSLSPCLAASQQAQKAAPKVTTAPKKAVAKSKRKSKKQVASWRRGQQQPTPERYGEIQQALIDKGYLEGPAAGAWGPDCVAALKRFQTEQKLEATGKLDALSLIRLGLGPKRNAASQNGRAPLVEPGAGP